MDPQTPHTWQEAAEVWYTGGSLAVFRVESEGATQELLWSEAFHCLRAETTLTARHGLSKREVDVVNSIVHVARTESWARMIQRHIDPQHSPAITVQKPRE